MSQRQQLCLIVTHRDFKNDDETFLHLHALKSHWGIHKEGDPDLFFEEPQPENPNPQQDVQILLPSVLFDRDTTDTARIKSLQGTVDIDDDNEPAPENIPDATPNTNHPAFSMYGSTVRSAFEDNNIMGFRKLVSLFLWIQQKMIFTCNCLKDCFQPTTWKHSF